MRSLRDIPSNLLAVSFHRCASSDLTELFVSPYEVQTSNVQSTTYHVCPNTKRVVRVRCSLYYAYNDWARYWNKRNVRHNNYLIPLKRTLPWMMGSPYKMGDDPMYLSAGGLFPDNMMSLLALSADQLDDLEDFYGQEFPGELLVKRTQAFKRFIQQPVKLKLFPDLISVSDSFWWTNPWIEEAPYKEWDCFHNGAMISTWLFRFPNPDAPLRHCTSF
jgi:hypothetical protein